MHTPGATIRPSERWTHEQQRVFSRFNDDAGPIWRICCFIRRDCLPHRTWTTVLSLNRAAHEGAPSGPPLPTRYATLGVGNVLRLVKQIAKDVTVAADPPRRVGLCNLLLPFTPERHRLAARYYCTLEPGGADGTRAILKPKWLRTRETCLDC